MRALVYSALRYEVIIAENLKDFIENIGLGSIEGISDMKKLLINLVLSKTYIIP